MAENYLLSEQYLYKQVTVPNKTALSELLVSAKGPGRTMRQFANEIGTSPATLSRLANGKNRGASNPTLLASIAEHADPESGVTYEQLMSANGMSKEPRVHKAIEMNQETPKRIILAELFDRGYRIESYADAMLPIKSYPSFVAKTNALCDNDSDASWAFISYLSKTPDMFGFFVVIITLVAVCMEDPELAYDRTSIIVTDTDLFTEIKKVTAEIQLTCEISLILIDINDMQVVDEYIFPNCLGKSKNVFATAE